MTSQPGGDDRKKRIKELQAEKTAHTKTVTKAVQTSHRQTSWGWGGGGIGKREVKQGKVTIDLNVLTVLRFKQK